MSQEIKFEIKLKAKEPINGCKAGETVTFINSIFDRNTGVAFFPIDKNFEIVYRRQFIGKTDSVGVEVYDGDIVEFDREEWGDDNNIHVVSWDQEDACWCFGGGTASDMEWRTVIGNIYENPNLIKEHESKK
jgi:hypothetical protein